MVLVILAGLCVAFFATLFKLFGRYKISLLPAVSINYCTAFICGSILHPPWGVTGTDVLWWPALVMGCLFVGIFILTGISSQKVGIARTTVAARMSLVLTVIAAVLIFKERPNVIAWIGIGLAFFGVWLVTWQRSESRSPRGWLLPLFIFVGTAMCDSGINAIQVTRTTSLTSPVLPTICFAAAAAVSMSATLLRKDRDALRHPRTWIGGVTLGLVNYASLSLLVQALDTGDLPASRIFPLMNIAAILFSTLISVLLFKETIRAKQWWGIGVCAAALVLIMLPSE